MVKHKIYPIFISASIIGAIFGAIALNALTAQAQRPSGGLVINAPTEGHSNYRYSIAIRNACKKAGYREGGTTVVPPKSNNIKARFLLWCR